jgi:glutaminase
MDSGFFSQLRSSSPIQDYLQLLHDKYQSEGGGAVASYIPELAKANPDWFGISLVTMDGHVYEVGDTRELFTIQSVSKPFVYGLALEDNGRDDVAKKICVEPSGDAFNSISLRPETGQPMNPMINAGAIAAVSLVKGKNEKVVYERILDMFSKYCGRDVIIDEEVYRSESESGHRNRAIGYMLRNFNILENNPTPILETYFKQCSIKVTCRDLAVIGGTLANSGINPVTGERAIRSEYVESVISIMGTCGMYDYAGEWIYSVGMPAKSGVAGGIVAVLPGQLGIGIFSPPLDVKGNSVRGIKACQQLSLDFNLHMFNVPNSTAHVLRCSYTGDEVSSNRVRPIDERLYLKEAASKVLVYELQGELNFATAEIVVRKINHQLHEFNFLIINLKRVVNVDESAAKLFCSLLIRMRGMNKKLIFTEAASHKTLHKTIRHHAGHIKLSWQLFIEDNSGALELCENTILLGHSGTYGGSRGIDIRDHEFFKNISPEEIELLFPLLKVKKFKAGVTIVEVGTEGSHIYLLTSGSVGVTIPRPDGKPRRLATLSAGVTFGEMAVAGERKRSANVISDEDVECYRIAIDDLDNFTEKHPKVGAKVMKNILLSTSLRLQGANAAVAALA